MACFLGDRGFLRQHKPFIKLCVYAYAYSKYIYICTPIFTEISNHYYLQNWNVNRFPRTSQIFKHFVIETIDCKNKVISD